MKGMNGLGPERLALIQEASDEGARLSQEWMDMAERRDVTELGLYAAVVAMIQHVMPDDEERAIFHNMVAIALDEAFKGRSFAPVDIVALLRAEAIAPGATK
jgi:hypothetical protein